ncbi:MAG: GIY-YIG nuclease family protein [Chitinophagaceae bacterium]|nr:GIY-YIG nuclease family protein [Chitinophagaceae bacterium]
MKKYYVYIITNIHKTVLYTGVTHNWSRRMNEHIHDAETVKRTFAGKYNCRYLLLLEEYMFVRDAIAREKEIKDWNRERKEQLISLSNPDWTFLNE